MIDADIMTAIVTPFGEDGTIDFKALEELTNHLIDMGNQGFVIGGTTGETPTLSHDEKIELYTKFAQIVNGRVTVIAGTGSNNTQETAMLTQEVSKIEGIDYALVVVPYYNKPDQRGMMAHFEVVAEKSDIPIIMYNIPGRTGVTMANDTVVTLSHNPNIVGVKQCTSIEDLEYLVENTENFNVYTGEDVQALSAKMIGANGVISVASHIYSQEMRQMYDALDKGNFDIAGTIMRQLAPKMQALFMYPSPSPVKAVLNATGHNVGSCRLPILPLNDEEKVVLARHLSMAETALIS